MATRLYIGDSSKTPAIVKVEEVAKIKYGASADTFLGDVVDGVLQNPSASTALNFAGVREIGDKALHYAFYNNPNIISVDLSSLQSVSAKSLYHAFDGCEGITGALDLSSLTTIAGNGMVCAFYGCKGITSVDLGSLQTVDNNGMQQMFRDCKGITSVDLSSLQHVYGTQCMSYAFNDCISLTTVDLSSLKSVGYFSLQNTFYGCKGITSVDLSSLQSVGANGLQNTFSYCTGLTTISFPSLTSVQSNSLGTSASYATFRNCTALTEIHFRADMQETIEAMDEYADKWGATNATVYFDL